MTLDVSHAKQTTPLNHRNHNHGKNKYEGGFMTIPEQNVLGWNENSWAIME